MYFLDNSKWNPWRYLTYYDRLLELYNCVEKESNQKQTKNRLAISVTDQSTRERERERFFTQSHVAVYNRINFIALLLSPVAVLKFVICNLKRRALFLAQVA